eukprot:TRINITY_DN26863_c0_g1_i1.p1 TRINITY_DN26863_c0_g1~~TRINITY_DN26863_c0_g1_i1.p1  ORF type:complete len:514 (-),score=66.16 TRINITY_DN26863_c0_g1_i1:86-1627(-)
MGSTQCTPQCCRDDGKADIVNVDDGDPPVDSIFEKSLVKSHAACTAEPPRFHRTTSAESTLSLAEQTDAFHKITNPARREKRTATIDLAAAIRRNDKHGTAGSETLIVRDGHIMSPKRPEWVDHVYEENVAVLVSDLSGFTSTTRMYGIIHFASIIVRMRQLCLPIFDRYGAVHIGTEADNFIVVFLDTVNAVKAAVEMQHVIKTYSESLNADRKHFKIKLNGIGIHCAPGLVLDKEDGLHGDAMAVAYHIGEDLAEDGNIIISAETKGQISHDPFFAHAEYAEIRDDETQDLMFCVTGTMGPLKDEQVATEDDRFLHPGLMMLARRHNPDADIDSIDSTLTATLMQPYTVLMINLVIDQELELDARCAAKFSTLNIFRPIVEANNGRMEEDVLWLFKDPADALLTALQIRRAVNRHNAETSDSQKHIQVSGYGAHSGNLLIIDGTDVHWGDPVNTASKIGQDVATGGDILVMPVIKDAVDGVSTFKTCVFTERTFFKSKVEFQCYSVHDSRD